MSIILQDVIMKTCIEKSELLIKDGTVTYSFLFYTDVICFSKKVVLLSSYHILAYIDYEYFALYLDDHLKEYLFSTNV